MTWIYQCYKKRHKYTKYYNFFLLTKRKRKRKKVWDKVGIDSAEMRVINWERERESICYNCESSHQGVKRAKLRLQS